jgi:hypothetical protein
MCKTWVYYYKLNNYMITWFVKVENFSSRSFILYKWVMAGHNLVHRDGWHSSRNLPSLAYDVYSLSLLMLSEKDPLCFGRCIWTYTRWEQGWRWPWITKRRGKGYWPTSEEQRKYLLKYTKSKRTVTNNVFPSIQTPEFFEKM